MLRDRGRMVETRTRLRTSEGMVHVRAGTYRVGRYWRSGGL